MNFEENEIIASAMIGFDMIEGPELKWTQTFVEGQIDIDFESFMMNFYLSFRGGNDGLKPLAILYREFLHSSISKRTGVMLFIYETSRYCHQIKSLKQNSRKHHGTNGSS
jgi:hypothetical protein